MCFWTLGTGGENCHLILSVAMDSTIASPEPGVKKWPGAEYHVLLPSFPFGAGAPRVHLWVVRRWI